MGEEEMKKMLSMLLLLVLTFSLVACGAAPEENVEADPNAAIGDAEHPYRVCHICSQLGDNSFTDSCHNGLMEAANEFGFELVTNQVGEDGIINAVREAGQQGYDLVCAPAGSDLRAMLDAESMDYPDTIFFMYDNYDTKYDPNPNVLAVIFSANESDFVAGAVAAKMSPNKVTGWVGAQEEVVLYDFLVGWVEGVKYADESASTAYAWIAGDSPYRDPAKAKELTRSLFNNYKADIMHGVAGQSGDGVIEAVLELKEAGNEVWDIGVDSDQYQVFMNNGKEEKAEVILTSALKVVSKPVYNLVKDIMEGREPVLGNLTYGIAEGGAGIAENEYFKKTASPEAQEIVEQITTDVLSEKIKVDSAYGLSLEDLNKLLSETTLNYKGAEIVE